MISIVTINYNNLSGLKKTVSSVLQQTAIKDIEYIIVDGYSSDGCKDYLETLPTSVKWLYEKDRGISDAFNKGLSMVTGDCVLFLNSGDVFVDRGVIEYVIKEWQQRKVDILSFRVKVNDKTFIPSRTFSKESVWNFCCEPHQGTFVSLDVFKKIGGFSEEYKIRMDYHFFARCRTQAFTFDYIPTDIVLYEENGVSMKKENRIRFWKEGFSVKILYNVKITLKDWVKLFLFCK